MPKTGAPSTRPNAVGLPGFTAMPWNEHLAARGEHVDDQVALADRTAAGEDDESCAARRVERGGERLERIGGARERQGHAAVSSTTASSVKRLMS